MGFKGNRGPIIIGIIAFIIIIAIIYGASSASPNAKKAGTVTLTVKAEMGVEYVKISNLNTATNIIKTGTDLLGPGFEFSCTKGDTLRFYVSTAESYIFNAWFFQTNTFDDHNPLTIQVNSDLTMTADMLIVEIIPE